MRSSLAQFSESAAPNPTASSSHFTTTTPDLKFSVHTGPTVAFHLDRPCFGLRAVGLTYGLLCGFTGRFCAYLGPDDAAAVDRLARFGAHRREYRPALAAPGKATRVRPRIAHAAPRSARLFRRGYDSNRLVRYIVHFHGCASARRNTGKTTDRWRKAARSGEAEGVSWLQARRNGQGDEALGGRMHVAGAKNRYASRTVESDVHPRYDGRGRSAGS